MGEYAKRISDGTEIKIGTCEEMLYLRFEERHKVSSLPNSVDVNNPQHAGQLLYRLPYPDEDAILPGDYREPFRAQRLYDAHGDEFRAESLIQQAKRPQIMITVGSGLIQEVQRIPKRLKVDITTYDYDTDGADEDGMSTDAKGKKCFITEW